MCKEILHTSAQKVFECFGSVFCLNVRGEEEKLREEGETVEKVTKEGDSDPVPPVPTRGIRSTNFFIWSVQIFRTI